MRFPPRRRTTMTLLVILGLGGLAAGACTLTTDLDGYSGGGPSAGGEGGTDAPSSTDGASSDANDRADGDGGDAGLELTCQSGDFCDDFERATVLGTWGDVVVDQGSLDLTTMRARSGAQSLHVSLGAAVSAAALRKTFASADSLTVVYSLFLTSAPAREVHVSPIELTYGTRGNALFLSIQGAEVTFVEQEFVNGTQSFFRASAPVALVTNAWVRVVIRVDLAASSPSASVDYGDKPLFAGPLVRAFAPGPPVVLAGVSYASMGAATTCDLDDVIVRIKPH